jgi:hypothetical protein
MEPRDARGSAHGGGGCSACGIASSQVDVVMLADRDDLAVVESRCRRCGSHTLGLILRGDEPQAASERGPRHPMAGRTDGPRLGARPPIGPEDVERMRRFLSRWNGDLASLLDPPGSDGPVAP